MTYKCLLCILLELPLLRALRDLLGLEGFISKSAIRDCLSKGMPLNAAREMLVDQEMNILRDWPLLLC